MKTVYAINGAPRSGKDTLARLMADRLKNESVSFHKCAEPLDAIAKATLGMDDETFALYREEKKDDPLPDEFESRTMRDVLIAISEEYIKPLFGNDHFGLALANRINNDDCDVAFVTDTGFQVEYDAMRDLIHGNLILVRVTRDGFTFENDSREHVTDLNYISVINDTDISDLRASAREIVYTHG